ncbi:MAG: hypothetical protein JJT78_09545, partial [Leptospira sp.]|nr:hypothetical protein [Leptospira sp.]
AFMAPPAHTDQHKLDALLALKNRYLTPEKVKALGVMDYESIEKLWASYNDPKTDVGDLVQQDAILNHAIGLQILHETFVETDIPKKAMDMVKAKVKDIDSGEYI